jgi:hypothetical protein
VMALALVIAAAPSNAMALSLIAGSSVSVTVVL